MNYVQAIEQAVGEGTLSDTLAEVYCCRRHDPDAGKRSAHTLKLRDDYKAAKARGEVRKDLPLSQQRRDRWARRLNDARRAIRDLR